MDLLGLNFVLNQNCNITCGHCFYNCKPSTKGVMELEDFKYYLSTVASRNKLRWVGLGCGGEAFLYYDRLMECFKETVKYDIKDIYVMTNAFWATTKERARQYLKPLKEAGLNIIWFSLDAFHQEFIPIENIINAATVALEEGIQTVCITSEYFLDFKSDHPLDGETRALLQSFKEKMGPLSKSLVYDRYVLIPGGRASDLYSSYVKEMEAKGKQFPTSFKKCRGTVFWGKNLKDPFSIEIDCNGIVELCPGVAIADLKKDSLEDLLENYNYEKNPIIATLVNEGIPGLTRLAEENGIVLESGYQNECHLCYEIRKALNTVYPQHLTPASCY
ncbi:radical SAM protein [Paenibacillus sp. TH7-28]